MSEYTFEKFYGFTDSSRGVKASLGNVANTNNHYYKEWEYTEPVTHIVYDSGQPTLIETEQDVYRKAS